MAASENGSRPPQPWLNSTVLGVGLASLLSDVGHEMATAALPAFLASLGAGSAALGLIEGLSDGLSSFAKLISGFYTDRMTRRKPLAVIGYSVTALSMASFALATRWWHVLLGRTTGWVGRGARSPVRSVLLIEATTPETYGRAFGLERAMDSAGAAVGPLLAMALVTAIGFRRTLAWTLVPGLAAALAVAFLVREQEHAPRRRVSFRERLSGLPSNFRRYLAGVGVAGLGDFSNTLLILWATQALGGRFSLVHAAGIAMLLYSGYNVVHAVSCTAAGHLADAFPKNRVLACGYLLAALPALLLLWPGSSLLKFGFVFGFSGLYMGFWETAEGSLAAALLPADVRGAGFGLLATVNGLGDLFSSLLVGVLWSVSPAAAMPFAIITAAAGAGIVGPIREPAARP